MAIINYKFADGHCEEIEVTEDFKREYEKIDAQERSQIRKELQQKYRAGMRCCKDLSLEKMCDDGFDPTANNPNPLEILIDKEQRENTYKQFLTLLTSKQQEVYALYLQGFTQTEIAGKLCLAISSVNERLQNAQKRILEYFLQNPKI